MAYGMTPEQFWDGEPELVRYYRKAYEYRREMDNERDWILGMYFERAIVNALNGRKAKYPDKPFPLDTSLSRERKRREQEQNERKVVDYFNAWAARVNAKFQKKQDKPKRK